MGKLAKVGIFGGQPAPVRNVLRESGVTWFDGVSQLTLKKLGLSDISDRLASGQALDLEQIHYLISSASLPGLLMLVETVRREERKSSPLPVVTIPGLTWLKEYGFAGALRRSSELFETMDYESEFHVFFEDIDIFQIAKLAPLLKALKEIFPKIVFVGPRLGLIVKQLSPVASKSAKGFEEQLRETLQVIKDVGFDRIRRSSDRSGIELVSQVGFPATVCTLIDAYQDEKLLAKELYSLNRASAGDAIHAWFPGLRSIKDGDVPTLESDFKLLRMLAVGSVVLRNIPFYRATSAFFSLEGVRLSFMFGANDFGFGAFNQGAEHVFNLIPHDVLKKVVNDREAK